MFYRIDFLVAYQVNLEGSTDTGPEWYHHMCIIDAQDMPSAIDVFDEMIAKELCLYKGHRNEKVESYDIFVHPLLNIFCLGEKSDDNIEDVETRVNRTNLERIKNGEYGGGYDGTYDQVVFQTIRPNADHFSNYWYKVHDAKNLFEQLKDKVFANLSELYKHVENENFYESVHYNDRRRRLMYSLLNGEPVSESLVDNWGKNIMELAELAGKVNASSISKREKDRLEAERNDLEKQRKMLEEERKKFEEEKKKFFELEPTRSILRAIDNLDDKIDELRSNDW